VAGTGLGAGWIGRGWDVEGGGGNGGDAEVATLAAMNALSRSHVRDMPIDCKTRFITGNWTYLGQSYKEHFAITNSGP